MHTEFPSTPISPLRSSLSHTMHLFLLILAFTASTTAARALPFVDQLDTDQQPTAGDLEIANEYWDRSNNYDGSTYHSGDWNRRTVDGMYLDRNGKWTPVKPLHGPHAEPGITEAKPDGSIWTTNDDGTITINHPDGSASTRHPDGVIETPNEDGTITTTYPDGRQETSNPQKDRETSNSNGKPSNTQQAGEAAAGFATGVMGRVVNGAGQVRKTYCTLTLGCR